MQQLILKWANCIEELRVLGEYDDDDSKYENIDDTTAKTTSIIDNTVVRKSVYSSPEIRTGLPLYSIVETIIRRILQLHLFVPHLWSRGRLSQFIHSWLPKKYWFTSEDDQKNERERIAEYSDSKLLSKVKEVREDIIS